MFQLEAPQSEASYVFSSVANNSKLTRIVKTVRALVFVCVNHPSMSIFQYSDFYYNFTR